MKWMIASDVHGSAAYAELMMDRFAAEGAGRLLLLGDLLYHGPRNGLPEGYAPGQVIALLNACRERLLCVRGNCDTEVDQMVLEFPIMADYCVVDAGLPGLLYATHGHRYSPVSPLPMPGGSFLLCGHTHVPACRPCGGFVYLNPGSVALPKEGSRHSYMTLEDGVFLWKDVASGCPYDEYAPGRHAGRT